MPRQTASSTADLGIRLDWKKQPFIAEDTVTGYVYRTTSTTSRSAQLKLSLFGQSESTMMVSAGYSQTALSGKCSFFDPQNTTQVLHPNLPLKIQPESDTDARWRFAITIPASIDRAALVKPGMEQKQSYLPLDPDAVASQPLPPTFELEKSTTRGLAGIVEYYLKAELRITLDSTSFFTGLSKTKTHEAILPLRVEQVSPEPPITDFQLKLQSMTRRISSQRLIPGMENAKLSFSQKTQKVFGSSKVPQLQLQIQVAVPSVMQLESKDTVPFLVGLEPIWESTSEATRGVAQSIILESLAVRLKPTTSVRVKYGSKDVKSVTYAWKEMDLVALDRAGSPEGSIQIPCVGADTPVYPEPVDVGHLVDFNLSLPKIRAIITRQPDATQLYPSFTTYNIQHEHQLSWELRGAVAGEKIRLSGSNSVNLLPKALSGMDHPPVELEAPFNKEGY